MNFMNSSSPNTSRWSDLRIGITGISGTLGKALTKTLREKGAYVVGLTSKEKSNNSLILNSPNELINWKCGEEKELDNVLNSLDILILNHGINLQGSQTNKDISKALEINALSTLRFLDRFEELLKKDTSQTKRCEVWVNTSEAEIQPAFSPTYEISKRLLGQIVSIKMSNIAKGKKSYLTIRKIILGPFKSNLNPIGIMNAEFVARQILNLSGLNLKLIIISPNPFTYLIMPIVEVLRFIYFRFTSFINNK